jgi:hypothetical protein
MSDSKHSKPIPDPLPRWYCRAEATIVQSGSHNLAGLGPMEPIAVLGKIIAQDDDVKGRDRNRHNMRKMPMGWNIGQVIPVGTTGIAEYIKQGTASLWLFTADEPEPRQPDDQSLIDHRKANYAMAVLLHYAQRTDEMPNPADFNLAPVEADYVQILIDEAVANTGGYLPDQAPLTDADNPTPG